MSTSRLRIIAAVITVVNLTLGQTAMAYTNVQLHTDISDTPLYDPDDQGPGCSTEGTDNVTFAGGTLPSYIKAPYNAIFTAAAAKYKTDPAILVAIFYDENFGQNNAVAAFKAREYRNPPPPYGSGASWPVSSAQAQGPFQFIPSTWALYAEVANGHPPADVNDLTDEAFAAAHLLANSGATDPLTDAKVYNAALSYNHLSSYAQAAQQIFDLIKQDEAGGTTTGSNGFTIQGCGLTGSVDCYQNPLRDMHPISPARIDEGVDYLAAGPVYALGAGKVDYVDANDAWPGGTFLSYILSCGPASGRRVYVAENCKNIQVHVGETVSSSTVLCTEIDADPWLETGWGLPTGADSYGQPVDLAAAYSVYTPDGTATAYGYNFDQLMIKLGAPAGTFQYAPNQGPGKNLTGTLPPGWPQW